MREAALVAFAVFALTLAIYPASATAAASPETAEPEPVDLRLLSEADVERYRTIFEIQEAGRWDAADRLIAELENDVLMGHVLFQRYMHPTAYRSKFTELRDWMALYADHPEAGRIYRLAMRRKPSGAAAPDKPARRLWRQQEREPGPMALYNEPRSARERAQVRRIERYVRSLIARERPTQSINYLTQPKIRRQLTDLEFDRIRQWIAHSYFVEKVDDKAYRIAKEVTARHRKAVPMADWTAGLAAWRMGDTAEAAPHFEAVARAEHVSAEMRATGAYWAARAYLVERRPDKVVPLLEIAAAAPLSFYGILANHQLGRPVGIDWSLPPLDAETYARLLEEPAIARVIALAQVGKIDMAEEELRRAHGRIERDLDRALLALAGRLALPHSQLIVALYGHGQDLEGGLYPVPDYRPADGFRVDRALIYAVMRQESKFDPTAHSRANAKGLMQLTPITAIDVTGDWGYRNRSQQQALFEPGYNMKLGQAYLERLFGYGEPYGNLFMLCVAYNGGPGNLRRWRAEIDADDDPLLFVESVPAAESRHFIEHIMTNLWLYRARLGQPSPSLDAVAEGRWPVYEAIDATHPPKLDANEAKPTFAPMN